MTLTDPVDTRVSVLPRLVRVRAGTYELGATPDDKFASVLELPRHRVLIERDFQLGLTPVTFEQWDAYADASPGAYRPNDDGRGRGRLPVVNVSWHDVQGYLKWLSAETGSTYRLPSEAEWEYACRAGSTSVFATGSRMTVKDANFYYLDYGGRPGLGRPTPVGQYLPNAFGLSDMHGNVAEWTADDWVDTYEGAPTNGSARVAPGSPFKVARGGGWDSLPRFIRCAYRDWIRPDVRRDELGFRVACSS